MKRGQALLRQATDEEQVPFVIHAMSPEIVKEFMYELNTQWAIFGTPEIGVAARGALALRHPVVMFAHNEEHEKILQTGLEAGIVDTCLAGGDFSTKTLLAAWHAAQPQSDSDSESSSGSETLSEASGSHTEEEDKKQKKAKNEDKKKHKKKNKKDKKHDSGKKKNKKKVKQDKKKKDKKGNQNIGKEMEKKSGLSSSSAEVMKSLIANESGTKA